MSEKEEAKTDTVADATVKLAIASAPVVAVEDAAEETSAEPPADTSPPAATTSPAAEEETVEDVEAKEEAGEEDEVEEEAEVQTWTAAEDSALMAAVEHAKIDKSPNADLLDDADSPAWDEIATKLPEKTALNCLQRYTRLTLREMQNMYLGTAVPGEAAAAPEAQKRSAEDTDAPDAKRAKVEGEGSSSSTQDWLDEDTEMLREMVTQFPNSELIFDFRCGVLCIYVSSRLTQFYVFHQHCCSHSKVE